MPPTITCGCGHVFRVREEDLGGEVYCPSCTRACALPDTGDTAASPPRVAGAESSTPRSRHLGETGPTPPTRLTGASQTPPRPHEAQAPPRPHASVFTPAGSAAVGERVLRAMPCPHCQAPIHVRVNDIGGVVYCAACTLGTPVGDSLVTGPAPTAPATGVTPPRRSRRWLALLLKGAASLLLAAAAAYGAYYTWQHPDDVPFAPGSWKTPPLAAADGAAAPAGTKGGQPTRAEVKKEPPRITLALIEGLLKEPDPVSALVDARSWAQMLSDQKAADADPRRKRLAEIIPELEKKAAPRPTAAPPSGPRDQLRPLLDGLRAALKRGDLADAQAACKKIDALLDAHPKELAALRSGYLSLKAVVRDLELEKNGPDRVKALLTEAERQLKKGDISAALLAQARARALTFRIPGLRADEVKALDARVRQQTHELRFARGKRAVDEARRCLKEGDAETRDRLVKEAEDLLSDQPTSRIEPLLKELKLIAARGLPRRDGAAFRRKIDFRLSYEKALEQFANTQPAEAVQTCREALPGAARGDAAKLADLAFEAVTPVVEDAALLPDKAPEGAGKLAAARRLLDAAAAWKDDPRWKRLDAELRRREGEAGPAG